MERVRALTLSDLAAALALQAECFPPAIRDGEAAFASRLVHAPGWCWTSESEERMEAYLVSHPWPSMSPPEPDTVLERAEGAVWYIHDLSVAPWARGHGLGDRLLAACRSAHPEIRRSELVAVPGAAPFWERRGWRVATGLSSALSAKVAGYGVGSVYMIRDWI